MLADSYVDMVRAGIIDPAKVTRSAVENAACIAGMILTTEALITDKPEEKAAAARRCHGRHGLGRAGLRFGQGAKGASQHPPLLALLSPPPPHCAEGCLV